MSKKFSKKINSLEDLKNLDLDLDKGSVFKDTKEDDGASGVFDNDLDSNFVDLDKDNFKNFDAYLRKKNREKSLNMKEDVNNLVDGILKHNKRNNHPEEIKEKVSLIKKKRDVVESNTIYDGRYPGGIAPNKKNNYKPIKKQEIFSQKKEYNSKDKKDVYFDKDFDEKIYSLENAARKKINKRIEESIKKVNEDFDKNTEDINRDTRNKLLNEIESYESSLSNLYYLEKNSTIDHDHVNINRVKDSLKEAKKKLEEIERRLELSDRDKINNKTARSVFDNISSLNDGHDIKERLEKSLDLNNNVEADHDKKKEQLENSIEKEINILNEKIISNKRNIDYLTKKDGEDHENVINERNNLKNNESRLKELENWEDFDANDSYIEKEKIEKVGSNVEKAITGVEEEIEKINKGEKTRPKKEMSDLRRSLFGFRNLFKKQKKVPDYKKAPDDKTTVTEETEKIKSKVEAKKVDNKENDKERELLLDELEKIKKRRLNIKKTLKQINSLKVDTKLS